MPSGFFKLAMLSLSAIEDTRLDGGSYGAMWKLKWIKTQQWMVEVEAGLCAARQREEDARVCLIGSEE